ncbi:1,3-propanediol dehydrogenase [Ruminiclostridium hungatei]|uniref:1,3-propanediol dehydrogenase n=1 Tax=Ruminiclostridium hungatei TaxID=48256 RepID=A0A1V4SQG4_RUMHU|nr:iron-containing alcohol dehydrogenase [Ruminiclostridium hungatei]OPX45706.1 1,3-propanediol dehydrogenase [Ruminiclostridium hungatei]
MMRPMKLAGSELMFGRGALEHLKSLKGKKAFIVTGGSSMKKSGILQKTMDYLKEAGIDSSVFEGVEPDPMFSTVYRGAEAMRREQPDIIIGLGGGSAMDAAKAMWVYYEHPRLKTLKDIVPPNPVPKLRNKAILVCIPSTSGTASEVSRSVVITDDDTHIKYGIGNMEMMPDIAICDPEATATMPAKITAETGMDALTHALEALVSKRANYLSNILARNAARDIILNLPKAYSDGTHMEYREIILNASMTAGLAFTNVSLGIVHSMAHTLGSYFGISHGLADAIILPYVMTFNLEDNTAKAAYSELARELGAVDLIKVVTDLNKFIGIPSNISELVPDETKYMEMLGAMAEMALKDGCTKTNPVIPDLGQMQILFKKIYRAQEV